jgi:toxin YoeB
LNRPVATSYQLTENALTDLHHWQRNRPALIPKIDSLIPAAMQNPQTGIGKPEPLKFELSGFHSRRITLQDRMIYRIEGRVLVVISLRMHY